MNSSNQMFHQVTGSRIVDDLLGLQPSEPSFVVPTSLRDFNETSPPAAAANEPHSTSRTSPSSTYTTVRSEYSSNTNTTSTTATQSSSVAKIIDIQKRPKLADRKTCRQAAFENETPTDEICQLQDERQNRGRSSVPASASNQQQLADQQVVGLPLPGPSGAPVRASPNQKQQSGDTLSSFESDYDLLVYLGETETEDIVDTERSLDYQDQTWRQSICGGASLAPTIDESLSELLSSGGHNNTNPNNHLLSDSDLLNTPTTAGSPFSTRSGSPATRSPSNYYQPSSGGSAARSAQQASGAQEQANRYSTRSAGGLPDDCDDEVSLVFNKGNNNPASNKSIGGRVLGAQRPAGGSSKILSLVKRNEPQRVDNQRPLIDERLTASSGGWSEGGQEQQRFGYIGNKFVSLLNRKPVAGGISQEGAPVHQNQSRAADSSSFQAKSCTLGAEKTTQIRDPFYDQTRYSPPILQDRYSGRNKQMIGSNRKQSEMQSGATVQSASNTDELDRLLAEMSQSLDLDSLALFDTQPYQQIAARKQAPSTTSQTLNKFQSPSVLNQGYMMRDQRTQHKSSQSLAEKQSGTRFEPSTASLRQPTGSRQSNQQQSCESILDEYDGASRMLEQMISDHLVEHRGGSLSASSWSALERDTSRGLAGSSSQQQQPARRPDGRDAPKSVLGGSDRQVAHTAGSSRPPETARGTTMAGPTRNDSKGSVMEGSPASGSQQADVKGFTRYNGSLTETSTTGGSQSRKLSTCSSSAATEQSVVPAHRLNELPADKRDLLESRSVWRHARQPSRGGQQQVVSDGSGELEPAAKSEPASSLDHSNQDDTTSITREGSLNKLADGASLDLDPPSELSKPKKQSSSVSQHSLSIRTISSRLADEQQQPPPPPAVDYNQPDENVISVEPTELPSFMSDEEDPHRQGSSQIDRMKRRTLSSMRSMRNKLTDFMSGSSSSAPDQSGGRMPPHKPGTTSKKAEAPKQPQRSQRTEQPPAGVKKKPAALPIPPKRSSSIGSEDSRKASLVRPSTLAEPNEAAQPQPEAPTVKPRQKRESRSATRRVLASNEEPPSQPPPGQNQSFGQQIRERLSRSKSRISRFLRPSQAKRAQSTPNTKQPGSRVSDESADRDLVQPGDIARNCEVVLDRTGSFNASLDRHLAASLAPPTGKPASKRSSSSSSSHISGLDTTATRSSRPKRRKSKTAKSVAASSSKDRAASRNEGEKRPASLLSLRRLSGLRPKEAAKNGEDLDSIKLTTTSAATSDASKSLGKRKRKGRRSKKQAPGKSESSSSQRSSIVAKVATTNEYFGQVAPAKVTESGSDGGGAADDGPRSGRRIEGAATMGPVPRTSTLPASLSEQQASSETFVKRPGRSQSLKSVGREQTSPKSSLKSDGARLRDQRTVSFSNLNRQRLPLPTNSFRPVSACAHLEHVEAEREREAGPAGQVKPVTPTCGAELAPESAKPPHFGQHQYPGAKLSGSVSPIRAKGSAMLGDFRSKCNQLFSTSPSATRKQPPSQPSGSKPAATPVRPPRRYNFRRRSKSTSGPRAGEKDEGDIIRVDAASPESTLGKEEGSAASGPRQPLGQKLSTFAQHLKESAADFFHPGAGEQGRSRSRTKERQSAEKGPDPLCVWQPVIQSNRRPTSARRSLGGLASGLKDDDDDDDGHARRDEMMADGRNQDDGASQPQVALGGENEQVAGPAGLTKVAKTALSQRQSQAQQSLDTDSTWESSGNEDDKDRSDDDKEAHVLERESATIIQVNDLAGGEPPAADSLAEEELTIKSRQQKTKMDGKLLLLSSSSNSLSDVAASALDGPKQAGAQQVVAGGRAKRAQPAQRAQVGSAQGSEKPAPYHSTLPAIAKPTNNNNTDQPGQAAADELFQRQREQQLQQVDEIPPNRAVYSEKEPTTKLQLVATTNKQSRSRNEQVDVGEVASDNLHSEQRICKTPFKFNANLPSPSQLLSGALEEAGRYGAKDTRETIDLQPAESNLEPAERLIGASGKHESEPMASVAMRQQVDRTRPVDDADAKFLQVISHSKSSKRGAKAPSVSPDRPDQDEDAARQNRLSIYENVDPVAASEQQRVVRELPASRDLASRPRQWRRVPTPEKPAHLRLVHQADQFQRPPATRASPPGTPPNWSIDESPTELAPPVQKLVQNLISKANILEGAAADRGEKEEEPPAKPKRRLVAMTSIIQEPEDELMRGATSSSSPVAAKEDPSEARERPQVVADKPRRDSNFSISALDQDDNSDTDSSFAAAEESRRRLLNKFKTAAGKGASKTADAKTTVSETPVRHIKFPAFKEGKPAGQQVVGPSGGASSLVKRLAKNFDQTIEKHSASAQSSRRTLKPGSLRAEECAKRLSNENSADEEPQSESTWYDAKSSELLLDEAEVADFLRDFDRAGAAPEPSSERVLNAAAMEPTSESLACSVSTGADPFVTLADSSGADAGHASVDGAADSEGDATLDGEDTLNDDDQGGHLDDEDVLGSPDEPAALTEVDEGKGNDDNNNRDKTASPDDQAELDTVRYRSDDASSSSARLQTSNVPEKSVHSSSGRITSESKRAPLEARKQTGEFANGALNANNTGLADVAVVVDCPPDPNLSSITAASPEPPADPAARVRPEISSLQRTTPPTTTTTTATPAAKLTPTSGLQQIDNNFKNSLNHIIARRSSVQSGGQPLAHSASLPIVLVSGNSNNKPVGRGAKKEREMRVNMEARKTNDKCSRKKELKGLSRYYHALLRHGKKRRRHKEEPIRAEVVPEKRAYKKRSADDYIHSSSSSSSSSSASSSRVSSTCSSAANSEDEEELEVDDKKLVRAAKKCSRLYEELEKILAHRAAKEKLRRQVAMDESSRDKPDIETKGERLAVSNKQPAKKASQANLVAGADEFEDEFARGDFYDDYEESLSIMTERDDQISLSSSSVSSESIPEMRQRQNLQKLYHVVNEIYSSEAKFVDTLKLLNVDFRRHMSADGSPGPTPLGNGNPAKWDEFVNTMLKHLPQLQALNENLLEELKTARDQWPRTQKIAHVLVKIGPFLKHYSTYIREFENVQQHFGETMKKYPQFGERVREFEANERCQKLTIQHHLLKPIQRIPQYRLLLQQYLHHLKPDDLDYEDTVNALEVVSRVAEHANQSMNEGANFAKLLALQAKIVGKQRDIVQPGRLFVKEGELMKVCRKQVQPRWFVLLNDALLYLTQIQSSDILYLNNELPLDDCQVSMPSEEAGEVNQQALVGGQQLENEFSVSTRIRSFVLVAKSRAERDDWVSSLRRTIDEYMARRRSFSIKQLQSVTSIGEQLAGEASGELGRLHEEAIERLTPEIPPQFSLLGQKAPIWIPDSRVTMCQLCTSSFSALFRRHHCRACGRVVCSACSSNKAPLMYRKCRAARVCDQCFEQLKASIHLYYLPTQTVSSLPGAAEHFGEQELRRLDEHFYTLLKSQFARHFFRLLR